MLKNNLQYYDQRADTWWQEGQVLNLSNHFNKTRFQFAAHYISNWQNLDVLDVGCGGGLACEFLAHQQANVFGIDQSQQSIEAAQAHAQAHHLPIHYRQGEAENLPYPVNRFDCVLCFDVLEHVSDVEQVIAEVYRVLKPGGIFLFDTVNRTLKSRIVMIWLLENILKQLPRGLHDWNKFIQPHELTNILIQSGFNEIETQGFDVTNGASLKTLRQIFTQGLKDYQKDGLFPIQLNGDRSICYIGKAIKPKSLDLHP